MRRKGGARQRLGYRRFATAAEAIRFIVEDFPAAHTLSPWMQVGDNRFDSDAIRQLYDSSDYPLGAAAKNSRREADGFRKVPAKTRGRGFATNGITYTARPTKRIASSRVRWVGAANSGVGMTVAMTGIQPWAIYEPAADLWDFAYFDSAAMCAGSTAEHCQVESGRTKSRRHHW